MSRDFTVVLLYFPFVLVVVTKPGQLSGRSSKLPLAEQVGYANDPSCDKQSSVPGISQASRYWILR